MNASEFVDDNVTTVHNQSGCLKHQPSGTVWATYFVAFCAATAVGIPGNLLSAIVWLRRRRTSSAVYLAALAINDLLSLLSTCAFIFKSHVDICCEQRRWLSYSYTFLGHSTGVLEPLLVLGFSVERLIAIRHPFQVCHHYCIMRTYAYWLN